MLRGRGSLKIIKEHVLFDYDFTGTSTVGEQLLGYNTLYGFRETEDGLRTYDMIFNDMGGYAGIPITDDLEGKIVTIDATFYSMFGETWTSIGAGFTDGEHWMGGGASNSLKIEFNTTYYGSFKQYDGLLAPGVMYNGHSYDNSIAGYGRTVATSGDHLIRLLIEFDFINWKVTYRIFKDGEPHTVGTYDTFTDDQINGAKNAIKRGAYFLTTFNRGFVSPANFLQKWKVSLRGQ